MSQKLNRRQARQTLYLSQFNFTLKHIPGKSIEKVDGLSRRPDWQEGVEQDNEDQKLIKPEWIRRAETIIEEGNLKERIKRAQEGDEKIVKVVEEMKKTRIKTLKDKEQKIEDRIVIKKGKIYVPEGELRDIMLSQQYVTISVNRRISQQQQRKCRQKDLQSCFKIMYGSCTGFQKASYQIGEYSLQWE